MDENSNTTHGPLALARRKGDERAEGFTVANKDSRAVLGRSRPRRIDLVAVQLASYLDVV